MTDCDSLTDALAHGDALPSALREHVKVCPPCASLMLLDDHLAHASARGRALSPSAELRVLLSAPVLPVRSFSVGQRAWGPVAVGLLLAGAVVALHPRPDLAGQSGVLFWSVSLVLALCMAAGVGVVLARGRAGVGLATVARVLFALTATVLFSLLAVFATHPVVGSVTDASVVDTRLHLHCAVLGSVVASGVLAVLLAVARRTAAVSPVSAGLAAGVAAGCAGALALQCACPAAVATHVLVGHGAVILVGGLVGALVGPRVLAP